LTFVFNVSFACNYSRANYRANLKGTANNINLPCTSLMGGWEAWQICMQDIEYTHQKQTNCCIIPFQIRPTILPEKRLSAQRKRVPLRFAHKTLLKCNGAPEDMRQWRWRARWQGGVLLRAVRRTRAGRRHNAPS
jgi:hypothetical protein